MKIKKGDLVQLEHDMGESLGIVLYKHPTKEVAQVLWEDVGSSWEKCGRLVVLSSIDHSHCDIKNSSYRTAQLIAPQKKEKRR
jgi:hypothetical protein